jgi:hypothetical protein
MATDVVATSWTSEEEATDGEELRRMGLPSLNLELYSAYWEMAVLRRENDALREENEALRAASTEHRLDLLRGLKRICRR